MIRSEATVLNLTESCGADISGQEERAAIASARLLSQESPENTVMDPAAAPTAATPQAELWSAPQPQGSSEETCMLQSSVEPMVEDDDGELHSCDEEDAGSDDGWW